MIQAVKPHPSPGESCMAAGGARALLDIQPYTGPYIRPYPGEAAPVKALGDLEPGPGQSTLQRSDPC